MSSTEPVYTEVITFKDFEMERWRWRREEEEQSMCLVSKDTACILRTVVRHGVSRIAER